MKMTSWILAVLALGLVASTGCRKAEDEPGPTPVYYGVKVDLPKLDTEFSSANQDVRVSAAVIKQCLRYAQLSQALTELGKLAKNPALTEPQKKVVNDLIEQTKQVIANSKPPSQ